MSTPSATQTTIQTTTPTSSQRTERALKSLLFGAHGPSRSDLAYSYPLGGMLPRGPGASHT